MINFSDNYNRQKERPLSITQLFEQQLAVSPNAVAVVFGNDQLTYAELNDKADALAIVIQQLDVNSNIIGISAAKNIYTIIGLLAILKAGKAYLPLDPTYPADRLTQIITDAKIKYSLVTIAEAFLFEAFGLEVLRVDQAYPEYSIKTHIPVTNLAYVLYTSGSTGKPKGVCMSNAALVNLLRWQTENSASAPGFKTLQYAPLTFDVSFQEIFATLTTGGTLIMVNDELRLDPVKLLNYIDQQQINRIFLPFVALQYLTEAVVNNAPKSLKEVMTAGEQLKITPQVAGFFKSLPGCILLNQYGPTESHVVTQLKLSGDPDLWPALPGIGKAISNTEMLVLDENLQQLMTGETGELCISGICLADGYLNNPALTAEKFIDWQTPTGEPKRIYRTGDLARFEADGNIEYLGRIDNLVKIRGNRVEPGEIEVLLSQAHGVKQAVVVAREYGGGQKRLIACLIASTEKKDTHAVKIYLADKLPDYMVPSAFVWLDEFPKTSSGKVDRNALPIQIIQRPELNVLYQRATTLTQKRITSLWEELLQLDKVGVTDNFFDLGGNSLLAINTVSALRAQFGYALPVAKLYQFPTAAGIAGYLDGNEKQLMAKPGRQKNNTGGDIAVIAMAGKFPGANNINEFWELLKAGKESTSFFTAEELDESIPAAVKNNPAYVMARGIIDDPGGFDARFFRLTPRMAEMMDPQQRVFLELAWEVLEASGYYPQKYGEGIGVYAGCANNTYYYNNVLTNPDLVEQTGAFQVMTLNEKDYIATRTAYELNLKGPAVSVYSACSTSLLAIAQAVDALRNGQCSMALAGGVTITSPVKSGHRYQEGAMLSKDGHCRPFDANATGTVFSDGAGVVLLKPLQDAINDGDTIYTVIKGTGVNNDGGGKGSFTAPSSAGQAGAIATAIEDAKINPLDISFIEAHGTATPLGDPIEIEGLKMAFGEQEIRQYCAIGSVKSNMGHLTAASGVAGFIKTALCIYHRQLVPSLFYEETNHAIDFLDSPFYVNTSLKSWESDNLRTAGISSFGVGGTNVHVVVQEYQQEQPKVDSGRPFHLINWSAKTEHSRDRYASKLNRFLDGENKSGLPDLAYTLNTSRYGFNARRVEVVSDLQDLKSKLSAEQTGAAKQNVLHEAATEVVFMFPGQGSQYVNMAKDLYLHEPVFKIAVEECAAIIQEYSGIEIISIIYPEGDTENAKESLTRTLYIQPAIFTVEYALTKLWISWGIKPTTLLGHSIGEFVAAHFAGIMNLEDVLMLITTRASMIDKLPGGSMLALRASYADVQQELPAGLSVAAINSHNLYVISGEPQLVEDYADALGKREIASKLLNVSHALHSPMMDSVVAPFKEIVDQVTLNKPRVPIVSSVTGKWLTDAQATDPGYWASHMRETVNFASALKTVTEDQSRILLESGPGNVTAILAKNQAGASPKQVIIAGIDEQASSAYLPLLTGLGRLWLNGIDPDWTAFYAGQQHRKTKLPGYAFDYKNYWLKPGNDSFDKPVVSIPTNDKLIEKKTVQAKVMRTDLLTGKIRQIFEAASGINMNEIPASMSFAEAGFDSLLLTQIALNLKKEFGLPVTFRKMYEEYNNISLLTKFLDVNMPADAYQPGQSTVSQPNLAASSAGQSQLDLITQQMRLLSEQIASLQNGQANQQQVSQPPAMDNGITPAEMEELKKPFGATARIDRMSLTLSEKQRLFLAKLTADYNHKTAKSKAYTQQHRDKMADPRVVSGFRPVTKEIVYPIVVDRSKGSRVWDIDGNEYIDALNGFGSNFLGYNPDFLKEAFQKQIEEGYEIGPQHVLAGEVCNLICEFTGFERAALCNTGSEAVLGAMRMARTVTGRSLIVAFSGSYHGINDEVLVRGTKMLKTIPAAAGIMPEVVQNMLILDYGTDESLEIIRQRAGELAAVLVEPVQSRRPEFQPVEFLKQVREITKRSGTALIFDEVITGFRMHPGGAQAMFGIRADIGTYGKVIGGGMPIGVIAGIPQFMDALDGGTWKYGDDSMPEEGVTYFAGTFVRQPLALAGARATLNYLKEKGLSLQQGINQYTRRLADGLNEICTKNNMPFYVANFGSLWKIKFKYEAPYGELLFTLLRYKGVHIWDIFPCFLTEAHKDEEVDFIIEKFQESVTELLQGGFFITAEQPAVVENKLDIFSTSPVTNARLGRDKDGNPAWFINDPENPGKYLQVEIKNN